MDFALNNTQQLGGIDKADAFILRDQAHGGFQNLQSGF